MPATVTAATRFLLVATLACLNLHAESPPDPVKIAFLGDSLTAGYGLDKDAAYPARLGVALEKAGIPNKIINAGVSGNTTAGGLRRLPWMLKSKPDVLVIALGGNDGLRGLDPQASKANLRAIIAKIRETAPSVSILLTGMKSPPNMGETYTTAFEAVFAEIAKSDQVPLVPFLLEGVAGHAAFNQPDGIHPNAQGQQKIADHLLPHLKSVLQTAEK